ncbi:MAG: stage II sporulation protein M [Moraxella sp.]|nr:stage II sporulation protein M [Moraxella sp.]
MKRSGYVKQAAFVARYEPLWQAFDELCQENAMTGGQRFLSKKTHQGYPLVVLYRQICEHYALARQRNYSPKLTEALHERVLLGHRLIYQSKKSDRRQFLAFVLQEFPQAVRDHARLFWLCTLVFYVPCVLMGVACYLNDELIYAVMPSGEVASMESMYDPSADRIGRERTSATDLMMFGHYVKNNVGIDFQVYASGLFFGIGTLFVTLYNGVVIGAVAGHLTGFGSGGTFWSFVAGHGSFELTGLVIAAMAGLKLAVPLIAPAPYGRRAAFLVAGRESIRLLLGAALMTFIAAFIEAFWSSQTYIPNAVKYAVAAGLWALVAWYLLFCGRGTYED